MKAVKLLTLTTFTYVMLFTALSALTFALFFHFLKIGVADSMDETLLNKRTRILNEINGPGKIIPPDQFSLTDFRFRALRGHNSHRQIRYSDTLILQTGEEEKEYVRFRRLTSYETLYNQLYQLEIIVPVVENEAIISSLVQTSWYVFASTVFIFIITTLILSRRLWLPFYKTLDALRGFEIDRTTELKFKPTVIKEFGILNNVITDLVTRSRKTFNNQKQFIENASHELQTPLAINQHKLEQLIDDPNLTQQQSGIVQTLINSTQRMIRLNKTLLLMAKIENEQFPETEPVVLTLLVNDILETFEDQREMRQITLTTNLSGVAVINANKILTDLLISNLIKNAFVHNHPGGSVNVMLNGTCLQVSNTSNSSPIPPDKLFMRFYKQTNRKESWGLGLAIVNKICTLNKWGVHYNTNNNLHLFTVNFN